MGDSVLRSARNDIPAALPGWAVTVDAEGSRRLTQAIPILEARRAEIGRVVVIQMGNNYIPGECCSFGEQIDQAMQVLDGVDRVVWLTVAEVSDSRVQINNEIRAAAERWPTMVVADWAAIVAADPALVGGDQLHLGPAARAAVSNLIAAAVGPAP